MVHHDFNELTVFAAVVEQGGLTPVANHLGLPKSTLSRRISQLENRVGQRLLLRHSNRLTPTEAGKLFYRYCRELIDLAQRSQTALDELREEASGQLVLHIHNAFERGWLPAVLDGFLLRYPQIQLDLQVSSRAPVFEQESAGDLWLGLGALDAAGLRSDVIGTWRTALFASPAYAGEHGLPEHPAHLEQHNWVDVSGSGNQPVTLSHAGGETWVFSAPASRIKVDSLVLQADAIVRGKGVGVLPSWYASRYEQAHPGSLVACLPGWQPGSLPVTLSCNFGHPTKKVAALQAWLRDSVPDAWRPA